jgi:DNA helicase HerA-like ATPase
MTLPPGTAQAIDVPTMAPAQRAETLGCVISVRGSQASVGLPAQSPHAAEKARASVGKFLGVRAGESLVVGLIADVSLRTDVVLRDSDRVAVAQLDLIGEIQNHDSDKAKFQRGVSTYPAIGDTVTAIGSDELRLIFRSDGSRTIDVGQLQQDSSIPALLDVDEMISKHFAVLGTTGVGKSSAVTLLLHQILAARPDLRVLLLDVHNEYSRCFGERAQVLNPGNIKLPFWLYNFDEIVDVLFGGRPSLDEEVDILTECIPLAKSTYAQQTTASGRMSIKSDEAVTTRFTVDLPVPYRISDLIALLDARMGKLENRSTRMVYHKLITRIETVCSDPRYTFMFENANVGGDTMLEILSTLFRIPTNGVPLTIMQLARFPSEVVDAVVSVTCRMAFDLGLWSDGANPLLVVCEEAHRYMAADHSIGFAPTRRSVARIAKEGRKYGVFLGLVIAAARGARLRPSCRNARTLFAMRMTNERDQALLRSAVADTAANLLAFLPSLGTGEALAFGEGVALPTRLKFKQLPDSVVPKSETVNLGESVNCDSDGLVAVVNRWRGRLTKPQRLGPERALGDLNAPRSATITPQPAPPLAAATAPPALDPGRFKLLNRPLTT